MGERLIKRGEEPRLLALLVVQQGLFLAGGMGLWLWAGGPIDQFVRWSWSDALLGVPLAAALTGSYWAIFRLRPSLARRLSMEQGERVFSTERPYGPSAILLISCSAGIGEEALFRGGLQTLLATLLPPSAAILAASALFTVAHPGSRTLMAMVAALSLAFGLAYHWSGSLLAVMIAHILYDIFGCLWIQRELSRAGHWEENGQA